MIMLFIKKIIYKNLISNIRYCTKMENCIIKNEFLVDSYKFQTQSKILSI